MLGYVKLVFGYLTPLFLGSGRGNALLHPQVNPNVGCFPILTVIIVIVRNRGYNLNLLCLRNDGKSGSALSKLRSYFFGENLTVSWFLFGIYC